MLQALREEARRVSEWFRTSDNTGAILLAVSIGFGAGAASTLFRRMIQFCQYLFLEELGGFASLGLGPAWPIAAISAGGLLVGLISKFFAPETKGHGVPEVMLAVARHGGRIPLRTTFFKVISAAICIGSGGSAGREGPIVQIGAGIGSVIGQFFRLPERRTILTLACGAAGGVAATFNAPMAGVIFALEVILNRFTALSFGLLVMSSATATATARWLSTEGDSPEFTVFSGYHLQSLPDLLAFIVLGLFCALVAQLFTRTVYFVEDVSEYIRIPSFLKPALGGALVGVVAIYTPQVMGMDYDTIESALNNKMMMGTLFVLCFAKIICTGFTVGSGGSGGTFAPALFIGAMFGGAYGVLLNGLFPEWVSYPGAFALVGMAAVFAGSARAPITAIFIIFEMTDDYRIIIPLMSTTVICTFVSQRLSAESIYTLKLRRRGINVGGNQDINLMDAVTVGEAMREDVDAVPPNLPVSDLIEKLSRQHETGYPVIDLDRHLVGIVTMRDVEEAMLRRDPSNLTVADICKRNVLVCRPEQTLNTALSIMGAHGFGRLPVINPDDPQHLLGILTRSDILNAYAEASQRDHELTPRADAISVLSEGGQMVIEQAPVSSGSRLAGCLVRDADFPEGVILGALRRGHETIVPRGSTQIYPGDWVVALTTRPNLEKLRRWLRDNT